MDRNKLIDMVRWIIGCTTIMVVVVSMAPYCASWLAPLALGYFIGNGHSISSVIKMFNQKQGNQGGAR